MDKKSVGIELRNLNNLVKRFIEKSSFKKQVDKITGMNGWIIGYLAANLDKEIYQKDLEKHFCITRSTASRVLDLMEQKGFIQKQSVPRDARLKKIVLTPKAKSVSDLMTKEAIHVEETLTKGFTDEELENLLSYIQKMKNNIESGR